MSLAGSGALAIWHDIALEGREEFYAWHGREHMPERVAIPGIRRGRRYVATDAELEFFNLYEAAAKSVLTGPDYRARVENPTPWTLSAVRHFRNVARSICHVEASFGPGKGGLVATLRYDVPDDRVALHRGEMARLLGALAAEPGICGGHLLHADVEASSVANAEQRARAEANRVPRWIAVVEGWGDETPFRAACREALSNANLLDVGAAGPAEVGFYRFQCACEAAG